MNRKVRILFVFLGIIGLLAALAFILQIPFVTQLWPWSSTGLSGIFIASIWAAIGMPIIWIGISRETAAMRGGAINLGVMYSAMTIFCFQLYASDTSRQALLYLGIVTAVLGLSCWIMIFIIRNADFHDTHATPRPVRYSFAVFAIVLLLAGGALVLKVPNIFPWTLSAEVSVMYGWVFLGAMCYFIYAVYKPLWANACGQLIGFLAYDLVLIVPYLQHFATVSDEQRLSLIIYVAVIIYSGLLAMYFLFIHQETRLFGAKA